MIDTAHAWMAELSKGFYKAPHPVQLCAVSHLLQEETSPMVAKQGTELQMWQNIIKAILLPCSFSRMTRLSFPLGP